MLPDNFTAATEQVHVKAQRNKVYTQTSLLFLEVRA
jgi:hypothetical protein